MYSYCNKCVSDKSLCSQCRDNPEVQKILASLPKQSFFMNYVPVCPRGYLDCVCDPAYIKYYHPEWYKKLYGNKTPLAMNDRELTKWMYEFAEWKAREFGVDKKIENQYIIAYKGKVFYCSGAYIGEVKDFFAIGAGQYYATAALYLGHSPAESVKVACALSCYVDEPIITKSIIK